MLRINKKIVVQKNETIWSSEAWKSVMYIHYSIWHFLWLWEKIFKNEFLLISLNNLYASSILNIFFIFCIHISPLLPYLDSSRTDKKKVASMRSYLYVFL